MIPKIKDPNVLRTIGFAAIALGGCSRYVQRFAPGAEDLSDFLVGMFIAIAVGCIALSMRGRRDRAQPS
jgi:hypothetical protein